MAQKTPPDLDDFWRSYQEAVTRLVHPITDTDGVAEQRLNRVEDKLGFCLPGVLHKFYRLSGNLDEINKAHNRLVSPEGLKIQRNRSRRQKALLFYEENQNVVFWGIRFKDMGRENPPVYQAINRRDEELVWAREFDFLSDFLLLTFYFQAVMGGLPHSGCVTKIDQETALKVRSNWPTVASAEDIELFSRDEQVLCILGNDLHVAGRTRHTVVAAAELLGVKFLMMTS
jgi:hypothetical protein